MVDAVAFYQLQLSIAAHLATKMGGNRGGAFSTLTAKRFTGQYHESAIPGGEGLSYYNARWYDSKLGRFTSADTIVPDPANPQDLNRYSYVRNNPLRYVDPSGHEPCANGSMCLPGGPNGYGNASNQSPTFQSTTVKLGYWLLYNEMRPNVQSPVALKIEQLHAESTGLRNLGLVKRSPSLLADAAAMKLEALQLWKSMVQSGAPWDHKRVILRDHGRWTSDGCFSYRFDIWSNIHYGYVGRMVGFSHIELLAGAGVAQVMDGTSERGYWRSWFDDPQDQASILIGMKLYDRYQLDVTPTRFWHVFDEYAHLLPRVGTGESGGENE
jgi:RHS repeat-associated protein